MEHKHDDRPGWVETWVEHIHDSSDKILRMLRLVPEGTHLHSAVKNNVAVRFPEYAVKCVYYWYYPDLIAKGVLHITGVSADIEKVNIDWPNDEDIASVEYQAHITELQVMIPVNLINDDRTLNTAIEAYIKEIASCPDCIYKRMLDEGMIEYQSTQTFAEYIADEREELV